MTHKRKLLPLIAVSALVLTGCGRTEINLNDYVTISYDGYDTIGTASCTIDKEAMMISNAEAFGMSGDLDFETLQAGYLVDTSISGSLDKTSNLNNGDTITFHWDKVDTEKLEDAYKIKLKYEDISETVTGLKTAEPFDPFDDISVIFEGTAPNATVRIQRKDTALNALTYTADKTSGLNIGDEVTVTVGATYGTVEEYCMSKGKIPSATEKKFTVDALPSYAMKLDEVPQESVEKMDTQAQETFQAYVAKNWMDNGSHFKGMSLVGNYFLYPKDSSMNLRTHNYLYFVYQIDAEDLSNNNEIFSYYYYTYYTDIMLLPDGTCSFDLSNSVSPKGFYGGESFTIGGKYHYEGYQDLDTLFNKQVTSKIDQYAYESTIN